MFHVKHVANDITNQVFFLSDGTKQLPSCPGLPTFGWRGVLVAGSQTRPVK
jgi:hypothetical protein